MQTHVQIIVLMAILAYVIASRQRESFNLFKSIGNFFTKTVPNAVTGVVSGVAGVAQGSKIDQSGAPVVTFYADINYQGNRFDFPVGEYPQLPKGLPGKPWQNDVFSSAVVPPGLQVQFWKDYDFQGFGPGIFTAGSYPDVGPFWNDSISSLKVLPA